MHVSPSWHPLEIPSTESWVYVYCWKPRSQTDVIQWIYGDINDTNIAPVIRARRILEEKGYLTTRRDVADGRSIILLSNPAPFVPYAEDRLANRPSKKVEGNFSDDERTALLRILDSEWFRKSFMEQLPFLRQLGMLRYDGALRAVAEYVEAVATISLMVQPLLRTSPTLSQLISYPNFDQFMESMNAESSESIQGIQDILQVTGENLQRELPFQQTFALVRSTIHHSLCPPLWLPKELAEKLSRVGRIQLTLTLSLERALRKARLLGKRRRFA